MKNFDIENKNQFIELDATRKNVANFLKSLNFNVGNGFFLYNDIEENFYIFEYLGYKQYKSLCCSIKNLNELLIKSPSSDLIYKNRFAQNYYLSLKESDKFDLYFNYTNSTHPNFKIKIELFLVKKLDDEEKNKAVQVIKSQDSIYGV